MVVLSEGDYELVDGKANYYDEVVFKGVSEESDIKEIKEFEEYRKEYMDIFCELRKKNFNVDMKILEEMVEYEVINRGLKSRVFYRIQVIRKFIGGGNVVKKSKIERKVSFDDVKIEVKDDSIIRVYFDLGYYIVMENVGIFYFIVIREGGDLNKIFYVDYKFEDGIVNVGLDYENVEGIVVFYFMEIYK